MKILELKTNISGINSLDELTGKKEMIKKKVNEHKESSAKIIQSK